MPKISLKPIEKAAAVVVSLGAENASKIYKYLKEEEIELLSLEIAKMKAIPPEDMKEILDDFYGLCVTQKVITEGGTDYAREILEKAFGSQQAGSYMERVKKLLKSKTFDFIRKADYKNLMTIIQNEHPQTITLILSYCTADQASKIISELPKDIQVEVIQRIAVLGSASPETVSIVENILSNKFSAIISVDAVEMGGVSYIAEIMNNVDRGTEKQIFDELYVKSPQLTEEIKKLMFVFEDIVVLDDFSIQRALREVDNKDLAIALKSTNNEVKNVIFKNMSSRLREQIETDIQYLKNIRMSDVEAAQQKIVASIRKLEEEGEIVISKGGKDDILV